jgi:nitroreductase
MEVYRGERQQETTETMVIAAVATNPKMVMICEVPEYGVDLAISADYMTVAAVDEGFGTCWIGAFSQDEAREQFG